jgi:hypothetical protein
MNAFFDAVGTLAPTVWLTILLDASLKGAILLLAAWLLSLLLRRAAAATRHLVWSLADWVIGLASALFYSAGMERAAGARCCHPRQKLKNRTHPFLSQTSCLHRRKNL